MFCRRHYVGCKRAGWGRVARWEWSGAIGLLLLLMHRIGVAQSALWTSDDQVVLHFSHTVDAGWGREVFVVGDHPDLGRWQPNSAIKLRWTPGNVWTAAVAINAGNLIEYKYIIRTNQGGIFCAAANIIWMPGPNMTTTAAARAEAPFSGKTVYYYSGWTNAILRHRTGADSTWHDTPMEAIGPGRFPGEFLYRAANISRTGEWLAFVPHGYPAGSSSEQWDHCPIEGWQDYVTRLDVFVLQDGHIYNYWPPATPAASAITTHFIQSSYAPQVPSRSIRVYVPRNYSPNPLKRYPVLYLHDGQNVFQPGGIFGCWNAEVAADQLIRLGWMRETILVAVDNTSERTREYIPPTDAPVNGSGTANHYLAFVLNNVKPFVDAHYRTLPAPDHTGVLGSSFGGIASLYFGFATNRFRRLGVMSASFWAIPNFLAQTLYGQPAPPGLRLYADYGTAESDSNFQSMWTLYNKWLADGYVPNHNLLIEVGCGQAHNEAAWAARLPRALTFLFNAREEPNLILAQQNPPRFALPPSPGPPQADFWAWMGWEYLLERTPRLIPPAWESVATTRVDSLMWDRRQLSDPAFPNQGTFFYRLRSRLPPTTGPD